MMGSDRVKAAANKFPKVFGLRAFPGDRFTINTSASYESGGAVLLYTYTVPADGSRGLAFSKGTPAELRREVIA